MSATNALTKSVQQTATPKLRTSILRSSRSRLAGKALTLFSRGRIPSRQVDSNHPSGTLAFLGFWDLLPANFPSEMLPQKPGTFQFKLKCLALYQALTKNFAEKIEIPEMLKCHVAPWPLSNALVSCSMLVFATWSLPLLLETILETFQAVSRNAETLALQMNHLREFALETIKKKLKCFGVPARRRNTVVNLQSRVEGCKGSHRKFTHPRFPRFVLISGSGWR
jgi:hypothetical protein